MLTTLIEIEEGLLSGLAAKAELRELLDELYLACAPIIIWPEAGRVVRKVLRVYETAGKGIYSILR